MKHESIVDKLHPNWLTLLTVAVVAISAFQVASVFADIIPSSGSKSEIDINAITAQVVPDEGFTIDATWGTSIHDMVEAGVLDPEKLEDILTRRYGQEMKPEWEALLSASSSDEKLTINAENSVFMMYVLWALAKHNDNQILHDSPFASSFADYDIGVGKSGYGDTKLIELTPNQQQIAKSVAENAYRPCCGQPTSRPDCSHGYSLLGLIELMASQGYTEDEIYDAALKFNSYWFPANYIQTGIYLNAKEGLEWGEVDPKRVMGKEFSSAAGSYNVRKALEDAGL